MRGATVFSKIDLRFEYRQLRIKDGGIFKITFRISYGNYDFTILPLDLTNVSTTFMNLKNCVFRDYLDKFVLVFLDDILIYSRNEEEHCKNLETVLKHLTKHRLYGKLSKCTFFQKKVHYLGHVILTN